MHGQKWSQEKLNLPFLTTSRGVHIGGWSEDVHHRRTGYRLRHGCECGVWFDLLDINTVLSLVYITSN